MSASQVTDGGLETDLVFHHGVDLPEFAAYPLIADAPGRSLLVAYFEQYADIAARAGAGLVLETPTWRANPDWGRRLGHDAAALDRVNQEAVALIRTIATRWADRVGEVTLSGCLGPRGDGYRPGAALDPDEAADYHRAQLASFREAGADRAAVLTLTDVGEAVGVALAAADVGLPLTVGFTVETDGHLPGGTTLAEAVAAVDEVCAPASYLVNCAHPLHVLAGLVDDTDQAGWRRRVRGLRVNASTQSHAELDEAEVLDDGDPDLLAADHRVLAAAFPDVEVVGGCCGTDARHVAALWGVPPP